LVVLAAEGTLFEALDQQVHDATAAELAALLPETLPVSYSAFPVSVY
jgi:hypothetical protein